MTDTITAQEYNALAATDKPGKRTATSKTRDAFYRDLQNYCGGCVEYEVRFHPDRGWLFDAAIPDRKLAIEYQGIVGGGASHLSFNGAARDMEKANAAVALGWKVLYANVVNINDGSFWSALDAVLGAQP